MELFQRASLERKKRYHHKTNTGCTTCRNRKIKCDEAKPECSKCVKSGRTCLWYTRSSSTQGLSSYTIIAVQPTQYSSEDDALGMKCFVSRTAPFISVTCGVTDFWTKIIPQASWQFVELRQMLHAVVSLDHRTWSDSSQDAREHYEKALQFYSKGLGTLSRGRPAPNNILLCSVLGWAFEMILGNIESANIHHGSARRIIDGLQIHRQSAPPDIADVLSFFESIRWDDDVYPNYLKWKASGFPVDDLPTMNDATEARRSLLWVLHGVTTGAVDAESIQHETTNLHQWRLSFDMYRARSHEPLSRIRPIYSLQNLVCACLHLQEFRVGSNGCEQRKYWQHTLDNVENILGMGYSRDIEQGVTAVLDEILLQVPLGSEYAHKAERLRRKTWSCH